MLVLMSLCFIKKKLRLTIEVVSSLCLRQIVCNDFNEEPQARWCEKALEALEAF